MCNKWEYNIPHSEIQQLQKHIHINQNRVQQTYSHINNYTINNSLANNTVEKPKTSTDSKYIIAKLLYQANKYL